MWRSAAIIAALTVAMVAHGAQAEQPPGKGKGDKATLGDLECDAGETVVVDGTNWVCQIAGQAPPVVVDATDALIGVAMHGDWIGVGGHLDKWEHVWVIVQANGHEFTIPVSKDGFPGRTQLGYVDANCGLDGRDPYITAIGADALAGGIAERGLYRDGDVYLADRSGGTSPVTISSVWSPLQGCVSVFQPNAPSYPTVIAADFSIFVPPFRVTVQP